MNITFDTASIDDYRLFLKLKSCPAYRWDGREAIIPDEYAEHFGERVEAASADYDPPSWLYDYQRDVAATAIRKRKYAVFAECGLGKTLIITEFARHAASVEGGKILIVSPLMVCQQTSDEHERFYHEPLEIVPAAKLQSWLDDDSPGMGITNYEAIREGLRRGNLRGLILDESSMLKSHYGKWGERLIEIGRGLRWKLCCTGTPAPNDRIEYANHAVFLDHFRTVNEFLATYFVNRGETQNRWEIKPHALGPFYRSMSHWCIFLSNPATYGWRDNCDNIPPIHVHIDSIPLTPEQRKAFRKETGDLFVRQAGGITTRGKLAQIAKGKYNGKSIPTNKPTAIRRLVDEWPTESTIIWCHYNHEQDSMEAVFPEAASIRGETPLDARQTAINDFKSGRVRILISKPKVLGFGLNLQVATRQVFSGLQDSYEEYHQAVKRSNRIGSTLPLNVHIPVTELEEPMVANVIRKAHLVESDTRTQETLFKKWESTDG